MSFRQFFENIKKYIHGSSERVTRFTKKSDGTPIYVRKSVSL